MALPAKWPWSLTLKPNCGTPGSSQWESSKPGQVTVRKRGGQRRIWVKEWDNIEHIQTKNYESALKNKSTGESHSVKQHHIPIYRYCKEVLIELWELISGWAQMRTGLTVPLYYLAVKDFIWTESTIRLSQLNVKSSVDIYCDWETAHPLVTLGGITKEGGEKTSHKLQNVAISLQFTRFELDHGLYMCSSLSGIKGKCSAMQQQWPHINPALLIYDLLSQRGPCPCQMLG